MTELFRIKPLEWESKTSQTTGPSFTAMVGDRVISVFKWPWEKFWMWTAGDKSCQPCASPEEGKQLAEQHWQEYIKQALEPHGSCLWKYDPDGYWETGCGEGFTLNNEESLNANAIRFCHSCGKTIEATP